MSTTTTSPSATLAPPVALAPTVGFRRLMQAEARKMVDTRSGRWLVIIIVALALAGAGLGISIYPSLAGRIGPHWHDTLLEFTLAGASVLIPVMAILAVCSEWTQRTALITFTIEPRRARVSAAKAVVMWLFATVCWLMVIALTAAATTVAAGIADMKIDWTTDWSSLVGAYLAFLLTVISAFAIALLLQHPAAAIVILLGVPLVASGLSAFGGTIGTVIAWTDLQSAAAPLTTSLSLTGMQVARLVSASAIWIIAPICIGLWRQSVTEPQ